MIRKIRSNQAVSEVIGVVLLLGITIAMFSVLNFFVFHISFNPSAPSVNLIGSIDNERTIIIEHYGGVSLDGNTNIIITVDSEVTQKSALEVLDDTNGDYKWSFGETVQLKDLIMTDNQYVRAMVVDPTTNTILLSVVLQQGLS